MITIDESQMSTCSVLNWTLSQSKTFVDFTELAEKQGHGPIHTYTGGWSNVPDFVSKLAAIELSEDETLVRDMLWGAWLENRTVSFLFAQMKSLWRYGYLTCPSSCSMDTPISECQCTCNATEIWDDYTVMRSVLKSPIAMFGNESAFGLLEWLCTSNVMLGDHATSASGADPSFWALHGTVERYLQVGLGHFMNAKHLCPNHTVMRVEHTWIYAARAPCKNGVAYPPTARLTCPLSVSTPTLPIRVGAPPERYVHERVLERRGGTLLFEHSS